LARRSRKRRPAARAPAQAEPTAAEPTAAEVRARRRARTEEKNAAVRATLEPLREGERPRAVTVAAVVALVLALITLVTYLSGADLSDGQRPPLVLAAAQTGLMLLMAYGLWRARYWAVLGMEALLGLVIVIFSLSAVSASGIGFLIVAGVLIPAVALFWFLVKAMARIQMPRRQ